MLQIASMTSDPDEDERAVGQTTILRRPERSNDDIKGKHRSVPTMLSVMSMMWKVPL
jgi:hypothetical protein